MPLWFRIARTWIPLAVAVTALCGLVYVGVQQNYRANLNDPQVQLAEDGAARLGAGETPRSVVGSQAVDIAASLAPFVIVVGADDAVIASSATLHGTTTRPPVGVLAVARSKGTNAVTWQPEAGVRIASVSVAARDGRVVVAGRNMRAVEARIDDTGKIAALAWIAALVGTLVATWLTELIGGLWERPPA